MRPAWVRRSHLRIMVSGLLALALWLALPPAGRADDRTEAQQVVERARLTLEAFREEQTFRDWKDTYGKVAGFLVYPSVVRGGFILGGAGGTGVLLTRDEASGRWAGPVFYTLGGGSLGLLAGVQVAELLVLVSDDRGVRRLLTTGAKLGADLSIVAGPTGAGLGAGNITADLTVLSRAKGLYAGMSLDGSVVAVRDDLNGAYYGRPVSPAEILGGAVQNPHAEAIRRSAAALAATR